MRKRTLKATLAAILAVILLAFSFTGCTKETKVFCDTETLRIERTGTVTTVYDTATIKIDTVKGAIIVTDKTAGITYTVQKAGIF